MSSLGGDLAVAQGQQIHDMDIEGRAVARRAGLNLLDHGERGRGEAADERLTIERGYGLFP